MIRSLVGTVVALTMAACATAPAPQVTKVDLDEAGSAYKKDQRGAHYLCVNAEGHTNSQAAQKARMELGKSLPEDFPGQFISVHGNKVINPFLVSAEVCAHLPEGRYTMD